MNLDNLKRLALAATEATTAPAMCDANDKYDNAIRGLSPSDFIRLIDVIEALEKIYDFTTGYDDVVGIVNRIARDALKELE